MKLKKNIFHLLGFTMFFLFVSCNSTEDSVESELLIEKKIEIIDELVESANVNAEDYWNNTELVWSDEFDGSTLSANNWLFETSERYQDNTELQKYVENDNYELSGGTLKITAEKVGAGQKFDDYTSVRLNGKYAFKYGRIEYRAKMPQEKGHGIWAKLWMLGINIDEVYFPTCGEIDLVEYVSHQPGKVYHTIHNAENSGANKVPDNSGLLELEMAEEEFHNYGLLWTHEYLKFYIDDIENITFVFKRPDSPNSQNWPFSQPFYPLMNIAVGGEFGGAHGVDDTIFPIGMEIDYVRVYHAR